MGTFANFIESDAFFPVLILLLLLLMFTFVSILLSGKKQNKKRLQDRKKVVIDEDAQIQLIQHEGHQKQSENVDEKELSNEEEIGNSEIGLVTEVMSADLSEVEDYLNESTNDNVNTSNIDESPTFVSEINTENPIPHIEESVIDNSIEEDSIFTPITINTVDELEPTSEINNEVEPTMEAIDEVKPVSDSTIEVKPVSEPTSEVKPTIEPIDKVEQVSEVTEKSEEIDMPAPIKNIEINELPSVDLNLEDKSYETSSAFDILATEDHTINSDVNIETPQEYNSDKTEVLTFPDFDSIEKTNDIENKVIDEANKYIESIMNK